MFSGNKFKKFVIFSVILFCFLFVWFNSVSAQLVPELKYPKIGEYEITESTELPDYISYIFALAILIGVIITVGVLIFGGFLFLTSTGKPEQLREAKDRIFSGFLGLVILLCSYLILNTVNPQLTIINIKFIEKDRGVELLDGKKKVTEVSIADVQQRYGEKFQPKRFRIFGQAVGQLKVKAFPDPEYEGDGTDWITSGEVQNLGWVIKSLKIKGIGHGIYLYGDQPDQELYLVTSQKDFTKVDDFNDKAKTIEIKNLIGADKKKETDFAAILHDDSYFKGKLRIYIEKRNEERDGEGDIGNVPWDKPDTPENEAFLSGPQGVDGWGEDIGVSSAHIFQIGPKENCNKVILYNEPEFHSATGTEPCPVTGPIYKPKDISEVCGDKLGNGIDPSNDKVQSIEIDGNCLVVLFENVDATGSHSEVFTGNDPDLSDNPSGKCRCLGGIFAWMCQPCASAIAVYPIK